MAYVTPNSTIEIFKNIPWDNTYEHTLYFVGNNTYPASHFQNLLFTALRETANLQQKYQVRKYESYSYQRKSKNSIKINVRPDEIYDYNYMRFKNTSHGNKWFYAFINDVEYINENTALIIYEIDVLQTYLDEIVLKESYVERKHTATDVIGENLEPEPVDFGDYVNLNSETPWNFNDYQLIMFLATANRNDIDVRSVLCNVTKSVDTTTHTTELVFKMVDVDEGTIGTTEVAFSDRSGTIQTGTSTGNVPYVFTNGILTLQTDEDIFIPLDTLQIIVSSYDYGAGTIGNEYFNTVSISTTSGGTVNFDEYNPIVTN